MHDPWTVTSAPPPTDASPAELLLHALQVAITAPSPGNSQPWRLLVAPDGEQVDLFTDPARARPLHDPEGQQRIIAGGAALGLLRVALRAMNLAETTTLLPGDHPELLARVQLTGSVSATPEETWLLQAAPKRRTDRRVFADRPVRVKLLQRLRDMAREPGADLHVLDHATQRSALAARVDAAIRAQHERHDDPAETWPEPGPEPFAAPDGAPARGDQITDGSPILALITTQADDPHAWLRAGEALVRVLLRGRVDHLYASFLQQPLARSAARWAVAEEAAVLGDLPQTPGFAQLALRLGYGADQPATPRRALAELLLTAPP